MQNEELTDAQKTWLAHQAISAFVQQFGENDIVKQAFMDILLETVYGEEETNEKTTNGLPLSGKTGQIVDANTDDLGQGEMPTYQIE